MARTKKEQNKDQLNLEDLPNMEDFCKELFGNVFQQIEQQEKTDQEICFKAANMLYTMYENFCKAGFNENQALYLTTNITTSIMTASLPKE